MDKRNSKKTLLEKINFLTAKLDNLYEVSLESVGYVGIANYYEREEKAKDNVHNAMYNYEYKKVT